MRKLIYGLFFNKADEDKTRADLYETGSKAKTINNFEVGSRGPYFFKKMESLRIQAPALKFLFFLSSLIDQFIAFHSYFIFFMLNLTSEELFVIIRKSFLKKFSSKHPGFITYEDFESIIEYFFLSFLPF